MGEELSRKGAGQTSALAFSRPVRHQLFGLIDNRKQWELTSAVTGFDCRDLAGVESTFEGFVAFVVLF